MGVHAAPHHEHADRARRRTAHTESYPFLAAKAKDTLELVVVGGRYLRRLEQRDGEWRIATTVLVADPCNDPAKTVEMLQTGATGSRDRDDPSYARPLEVTRARTDVVAS